MRKSIRITAISTSWALLTLVWATVAAAAPAKARAEPVCDLVASDYIAMDGLLDDWRDIARHRIGDGVQMRCVYDRARLFLAIEVNDQRVVRRGGSGKGAREDQLRLGFRVTERDKAKWLEILPGTDTALPVHRWGARPLKASGGSSGDGGQIAVQDSLQERGWSLEAVIPLAAIPGSGPGTPAISLDIAYNDVDGGAAKARRSKALAILRLREAEDSYAAFLQASGNGPGDVRADVLTDVDGVRGAERVVIAGTAIAVISDRYAYMTLPVAAAGDVLYADVVDVRGDGTASIVTAVRQFGGGGSRDLLMIWHVGGRGDFAAALVVEVGKAHGDRVLSNRWSLVPKGPARGQARTAGRDLVIEVGASDVRGWSRESYLETPAADARPILKPWNEQTSAVYYFEGTAVLGGDAKVAGFQVKGGRPR